MSISCGRSLYHQGSWVLLWVYSYRQPSVLVMSVHISSVVSPLCSTVCCPRTLTLELVFVGTFFQLRMLLCNFSVSCESSHVCIFVLVASLLVGTQWIKILVYGREGGMMVRVSCIVLLPSVLQLMTIKQSAGEWLIGYIYL